MFLYRKALFLDLEERHTARVLAVPTGKSQLSHSLRQSFPSVAEMKSTSAPGKPRGKAVGELPACQEWSQQQLCRGMMLLCAGEVGAEQVMARPARWSWQRSSSRDSRQPQGLITSSKAAGDPGFVF